MSGAVKQVLAFPGGTVMDGAWVLGLARREPVFWEMLQAGDALVRQEAGWSPLLELRAEGGPRLAVSVTFPLVVGVQVAALAALRAHGVDGDAVFGVCAGEVSAAHAAGAFGWEDALRIALHGGRSLEPEARRHRMLIAWLPESECASLLATLPAGAVGIGARMEPGVTVLAGDADAVAVLARRLTMAGVRTRALPFPWGVHVRSLREGRAVLEAALEGRGSLPLTRPMLSGARARWFEEGASVAATHWWDMLREEVRFLHSVQALETVGAPLLIEVGPVAEMSHLAPRLGARAITLETALSTAGALS
ncbi:acyltransferase domain-containing protein [Corallococcus sp. bb12-1]|uniref:acyltransferase domain-containing protein n=1 Tax=Corallococcus sp. bb12-1 TaxID=2996784 RepID=UPI00226EEE0F|nr:acyltransferase domain-containing protein [Corallococcus sp. bb12-1]MCY1042094.1 acyltransferase domain-containing protein [Corallococcus sp. bb12-1]